MYHAKVSRILVLTADFCLIAISFALSQMLWTGNGDFMKASGLLFVLFCLSWWIVSGISESVSRISMTKDFRHSIMDLLTAFCFHLVIVFVCILSLGIQNLSQSYLISIYSFAFVSILLGRFVLTFATKQYKNLEYGKVRKVVIIGGGNTGQSLYRFFQRNPTFRHRFMGFFDESGTTNLPQGLLKGNISEVKSYCLEHHIDEIYFTLPLNEHKALIDDLTRFADDNFLFVRLIPDFSSVMRKDVNMYFLDQIPVITIRKEPLEVVFNQILKRSFDIVFSLTVILLVFPFVLPPIALLIKLSSEGPIFFTQLRPGKKNRLFKCYKFRTMRPNNQTELQATKNDPRVTRIGRFLRKTNLDELPQFFNVLLGDMSVVGPRPNLITQLEEYSKVIEHYKVRHFVNPGITGYAQVNGYRGETKQLHLMQKRVEYDVMYMENWSFMLDLKIIFLTVWNMVKGEKNAY